jgi:glycosyltransferase involved in cell wall biosynthesis
MTRGAPLVTVLTWCRNISRTFFDEAVRSVLVQSSADWELLIVVDPDDGRTLREVEATLAALPRRDSRIQVVRNEGRFITGAFNTGMRRASTPYVCVLHADDLLESTAVEVVTEFIRRYRDVDYFHSSRVYVDGAGRPISGILRAVSSFTLLDFWNIGPVKALHCWKVASARAIGGMDESLGAHGADDYDFSWRMAEAGFSFMAIPACLYRYRDHREHHRLTTHVPLDRQVEELQKIWRKHRLPEAEIQRQLAKRSADYLRQALFATEADRRVRESAGFDGRSGWRQPLAEAG